MQAAPKTNHLRGYLNRHCMIVIRFKIVVLYNGTKKALLVGGAIKVRYTNVFHCIDTARVGTRESDGVQCGAE